MRHYRLAFKLTSLTEREGRAADRRLRTLARNAVIVTLSARDSDDVSALFIRPLLVFLLLIEIFRAGRLIISEL